MKKIVYLYVIILFMAFIQICYTQSNFIPACVHTQQAEQTTAIGGYHKPERTDQYQGTDMTSVFPVIMVFVKFPSGEPNPADLNWPLPPYGNGDPIDLNNHIAPTRNNNYGSEWWNAYSEQTARVSDFHRSALL